jgi:hypothetical protein
MAANYFSPKYRFPRTDSHPKNNKLFSCVSNRKVRVTNRLTQDFTDHAQDGVPRSGPGSLLKRLKRSMPIIAQASPRPAGSVVAGSSRIHFLTRKAFVQ